MLAEFSCVGKRLSRGGFTWSEHRQYLPVWLTPPVKFPAPLGSALGGLQWIETHNKPRELWLPQLLNALSKRASISRCPSPNPGEAEPAQRDRPVGEEPGLRFRRGTAGGGSERFRLWLGVGVLVMIALVGILVYVAIDKGVDKVAGKANPKPALAPDAPVGPAAQATKAPSPRARASSSSPLPAGSS